MLNTIYVNHQKEAIYPSGKYFFSPSKDYPEYAYETISEETNYVYDMIRDSFLKMRLDKEHYGKSNWNPLGDIIHPGDTVLIKPNLVTHKNLSGGGVKLSDNASVYHKGCFGLCSHCIKK